MKGVRFYEEYKDLSKKCSAGNVVAVFYDQAYWSGNTYCYNAVAALHTSPNSPVASTEVSPLWLRKHAKRIPESKARQIHPRLFQFLD